MAFFGLSILVAFAVGSFVNGDEFSLEWSYASATFYGGSDASGTMGGACGYGNLYDAGYGVNNAALSTTLFNNGAACGACYEIKCHSSEFCKFDSIIVTATNFCPPNYALPNDNGGWCNPPREHFDLSQPMFERIAQYRGGIVPVNYRRVTCMRNGGMRFTITGHTYFYLVLVANVGSSGDVQAMFIRPRDGEWQPMQRNWGQMWHHQGQLDGLSLSFKVITSNNKRKTSRDVVPQGWTFGQTFVGAQFT